MRRSPAQHHPRGILVGRRHGDRMDAGTLELVDADAGTVDVDRHDLEARAHGDLVRTPDCSEPRTRCGSPHARVAPGRRVRVPASSRTSPRSRTARRRLPGRARDSPPARPGAIRPREAPGEPCPRPSSSRVPVGATGARQRGGRSRRPAGSGGSRTGAPVPVARPRHRGRGRGASPASPSPGLPDCARCSPRRRAARTRRPRSGATRPAGVRDPASTAGASPVGALPAGWRSAAVARPVTRASRRDVCRRRGAARSVDWSRSMAQNWLHSGIQLILASGSCARSRPPAPRAVCSARPSSRGSR